ncbi:MAG: hypothetical protein JXR37_12305 [Kiritimatiellae bacterium]|nr:hypothetical protein [Kiritimatiellia bacterium]
MKLLILHSRPSPDPPPAGEPYLQSFNTRYAERVIGNLRGEPAFCSACGPDCTGCRRPYGRRFGADMAGVIALPSVLPHVLENPAAFIPGEIPRHDVILAVHIHEQILLEFLKRCPEWGTRGLVVPCEAPGWVLGATRREAFRLGERAGVEVAFPKPFCAFAPPAGSVLAAFRAHFHIGCPNVELRVERRTIVEARVEVSAACGATYYIARWLVGRSLDENLEIDVVSKRLHTYPCTASMEWDDEIDESPLHIAGQAHYRILSSLGDVAERDSGMVMSPVGRMVQKPAPVYENLKHIEDAKREVMKTLHERAPVTLPELRRTVGSTPAALHSALLLLKQEGRIRVEKGAVYPRETS